MSGSLIIFLGRFLQPAMLMKPWWFSAFSTIDNSLIGRLHSPLSRELLREGNSMSRRIRPKITVRGFKPGARGAGHVLGELETAVMEILWRVPGQTVNQVEEQLRERRGSAHTTVLTTLDRMHRKGYLLRAKGGKAYVYTPRYTREEFELGIAQEVLGALLGQFAKPARSAFVDLLGDDDKALSNLETMVQERRRELGKTKNQ